MVGPSETATFLVYLEGAGACWIDTCGNILARLYSQQIAERQVRRDNRTLWILRDGDTNRQNLHDRLKLGYPLLELSIEIANLLFSCDLGAYIRAGARPSPPVPVRVADRYSASEKPAVVSFPA